MINYSNTVVAQFDTDTFGNSEAFATVTVREKLTGFPATLYKSNSAAPGNEADNPVVANAQGNYSFYVQDGRYDLVINEGQPSTYTIEDVSIFEGSIGLISNYLNDDGSNFGEAVVNASVDNYIVNFEGMALSTDDLVDIRALNAKCHTWIVNEANLTFTQSELFLPENKGFKIKGAGTTIKGGLELHQIAQDTGFNTKIVELVDASDVQVNDYFATSLDNDFLPNSSSRIGYVLEGDFNRVVDVTGNTVTLAYEFLRREVVLYDSFVINISGTASNDGDYNIDSFSQDPDRTVNSISVVEPLVNEGPLSFDVIVKTATGSVFSLETVSGTISDTGTITFTPFKFIDESVKTGLLPNAWVGNASFQKRGITFSGGGDVLIEGCSIENFQGYFVNVDDGTGDLRKSTLTLKDSAFDNAFIDSLRFRGFGIECNNFKHGRQYDFSKQFIVTNMPKDGFISFKNGCDLGRQNRDAEIFAVSFDGVEDVECGKILTDGSNKFDGKMPDDLPETSFQSIEACTGSFVAPNVINITTGLTFFAENEGVIVSNSVSNNGNYTIQSVTRNLEGFVTQIITSESTIVAESGSYDIKGQVYWGRLVAINDALHFFVPNGDCVVGGIQCQSDTFNSYFRSIFGTSFAPKNVFDFDIATFNGTTMQCEPIFVSIIGGANAQERYSRYVCKINECKVQSRGLNNFDGGCHIIDSGSQIVLPPENRYTPSISNSQTFNFVAKSDGELDGRYIVGGSDTKLNDVAVPYKGTSNPYDLILFSNGYIPDPNANHLILKPPVDNNFEGTGLPLEEWKDRIPTGAWFASNVEDDAPAPPVINFKILTFGPQLRYGSVNGFADRYTETILTGRDDIEPIPTRGKWSANLSTGDLIRDTTNLTSQKVTEDSQETTANSAGTEGVTNTITLTDNIALNSVRYVAIYNSGFQSYFYYIATTVGINTVTFENTAVVDFEIGDLVFLINASEASTMTSGGFVPTFISGAKEITAGASGAILTLTPPSGERVRLDVLTVVANEQDMAIKSNGNTIIEGEVNRTPGASAVEERYSLATVGGNDITQSNQAVGIRGGQVFATDAVVTIEKTTGSTVNTIYYSYSFGV